jgi:hypothetical protein
MIEVIHVLLDCVILLMAASFTKLVGKLLTSLWFYKLSGSPTLSVRIAVLWNAAGRICRLWANTAEGR